jgi:hypothetical protein
MNKVNEPLSYESRNLTIYDADGQTVADIWINLPDPDADKYGSQFAASSKLLEACKKARPELRCLYQQLTGKCIDNEAAGSVKAAVDALTAAIAAAEGGKA